MKKVTAFSPLTKHGFLVILAPIFKLFECICELLVPFLVKEIIDYGLTDVPYEGWGYTLGFTNNDSIYHNLTIIFALIGVIFALAILGFLMTLITQFVSSKVASQYGRDLRDEIHHQIQLISPNQLENFGKGKALNLMTTDSDNLLKGVNSFMRLLVRAPFLVIGSVIASFLLSPIAGLCVLLALGCSSIAMAIVLAITPKKYASLQRSLDEGSSKGEEDIKGGRVIRAFNKQEQEKKAFSKINEDYRVKAISLAKINSLLNPLTFAFINLGILFILYLGSYGIDYSGLSLGTIVAVISFFTQSLAALFQFALLLTNLTKAASSKKRIDGFLSLVPAIVDGRIEEIAPLKEGDPLFEFNNVSVCFGGESNALSDITLKINKGEKVALIGGTGSGKSTILNLMERFLNPSDGHIHFEGEDISCYKLDILRSQISFVMQGQQLFKGTIRSNLLVGKLDASEQEMRKAINASKANVFIDRYSDGLDHEVDENGSNLSGGEKQRLLIARAILSNRPILILDDATSALDYKTDLEVRKNIFSIKGLTVILVSQRASSIKDCDNIYVLDNGKIIDQGNHPHLLSHCPIYKEIYQTQVSQR